jgi:thiol-disulfide isomerase/thioredoxin
MGQKSVAQQPIVELHNGIDEAKKLFQQSQFVVLAFVAQWCPYCKDLKKTLTYHLK